MPVACFQAVGESLKIKTHPVEMWIGFDLDPLFVYFPPKLRSIHKTEDLLLLTIAIHNKLGYNLFSINYGGNYP